MNSSTSRDTSRVAGISLVRYTVYMTTATHPRIAHGTAQATAWSRAGLDGARHWDVEWVDDLGRKRGQCLRTTPARLQEQLPGIRLSVPTALA